MKSIRCFLNKKFLSLFALFLIIGFSSLLHSGKAQNLIDAGYAVPFTLDKGELIPNFLKISGGTTEKTVFAIIPDGNKGWYIGGEFDKVGDQSIKNLVHLLSDNTIDMTWKPEPDASVRALALSPDKKTLYVGGNFSNISGQPRQHLASFNTADGQLKTWTPLTNASVHSIVFIPNNNGVELIGISGVFDEVAVGRNGVAIVIGIRRGIAIMDDNGNARSWNAKNSANNTIDSIAVNPQGDTLYASGKFTDLIGANQLDFKDTNLVSLDTTDGYAIPLWHPIVDQSIHSMLVSADGKTLYIGGDFHKVNGQDRNGLAAIDTATGAPTAWNPNTTSNILSMFLQDKVIFAQGGFFGAKQIPNCAAAIKEDGTVIGVGPHAISCSLNSIAVSGNTVYVGGTLTNLESAAGGGLNGGGDTSGKDNNTGGGNGGSGGCSLLTSELTYCIGLMSILWLVPLVYLRLKRVEVRNKFRK